MEKLMFLRGDRLYLRPLSTSDANGDYPSWLNDEQVCEGNSHHVHPYPLEQAIEYLKQSSLSRADVNLAIVLHEGEHHIGNIALQRINWVWRTADLSILLGDKEQWGKGYGFEAAGLLTRHAFQSMNLERIACATFFANAGMRRLAERLGMRQEGVRRKAAYKAGKYVDIIEYGLLRDEFEAQVPQGAS